MTTGSILLMALMCLPGALTGGGSAAFTEPIIVDHACTDITRIPEGAIVQAKTSLHIAYGHTSHGSQLTTGMTGLVAFADGGGKGLSLPKGIFAWNNGHFECECYHPLFLFNQDGDMERALLRCGNVATADDWQAVLEPVIERYRRVNIPNFFRGDAAFAIPQLYEVLEATGYQCAIRLKANTVLEHHIVHLLTRPVGRPPKQPQRVYHRFEYRAESWDRARRVVVKIGSKIVHHARYVTFQLAEVAVSRGLYRAILDRIQRFAAIPPRAAPI